jgi:hypothetical protein
VRWTHEKSDSPAPEPLPSHLQRPSLQRTLLWVGTWKLALLTLGCAVAVCAPQFFNLEEFVGSFHRVGIAPGSLASRLSTWDAQYYLHLAESGYAPGHESAVFYPLWPALMRLAMPLAGGSALVAGLLLSHLLFLAACALLYRQVEAKHGARAAAASVLVLLAHPGALFCGLVYTESLFLLLSVGLFVALEQRRFGHAALAAALLPLTRAVGAFAVLPIAWIAYRERDLRACATLLAPLLGLACYFAWMHAWTGDAFSGMEAQRYFKPDGSLAKLLDPLGFARELLTVHWLIGGRGGALDRVALIASLAGLVWMWIGRRCSFEEWIWMAALCIVSAVTMSLMSFMRYAAVLTPLFVALGVAAARAEDPRMWRIALRLALAVQALFFVVHTSNYWIG